MSRNVNKLLNDGFVYERPVTLSTEGNTYKKLEKPINRGLLCLQTIKNIVILVYKAMKELFTLLNISSPISSPYEEHKTAGHLF